MDYGYDQYGGGRKGKTPGLGALAADRMRQAHAIVRAQPGADRLSKREYMQQVQQHAGQIKRAYPEEIRRLYDLRQNLNASLQGPCAGNDQSTCRASPNCVWAKGSTVRRYNKKKKTYTTYERPAHCRTLPRPHALVQRPVGCDNANASEWYSKQAVKRQAGGPRNLIDL